MSESQSALLQPPASTASPPDAVDATLRHALDCIPYYQHLPLADRSRPQLGDFPVVDGARIAQTPEAFYCLDRFPDFIITTGGTTGAAPKFFIFNLDEYDAAYQARLGGSASGEPGDSFVNPDGFEGVALSLGDDQHGVRYSPRHGQPVLSLPLDCGRHLELVVRFLLEGIVVRRRRYPVISLFGSITKLRCLTRYCQARGYTPDMFALRRIVALAFHLSQKWRRILQEFWAADVVSGYGLTEFSSGLAIPCPHCGGHRLPAAIHREVLSADRRQAVAAGLGLLVLTSLYPFRKAMPLIRYDTHDIVELLAPCRHCGPGAFKFHGREGTVAWRSVAGGRQLVAPLAILDALETLDAAQPGTLIYDEAVAGVMASGSGLGAAPFLDAGYPRLHLAEGGEDRALQVFVEHAATVSPAEFDGRLLALLEQSLGHDCSKLVKIHGLARGGLEATGRRITLI